jgi:hypothetical protein
MTMNAALGAVDPAPRARIAWFELTCLPCGEVAGYVEDDRIVRPVYPGGIRLDKGRPRCGRCNGLLLSGNRGVASTRSGIG